VLEQGYPALDYDVLDGDSTDGSVEILRHYGSWRTSWVSEPDQGQVDAILKGLARARACGSTGSIRTTCWRPERCGSLPPRKRRTFMRMHA
jgi:hypothetical protein